MDRASSHGNIRKISRSGLPQNRFPRRGTKVRPRSCFFVIDDEDRDAFREFNATETSPDVILIGDIGQIWTYDLVNRIFQIVMGGADIDSDVGGAQQYGIRAILVRAGKYCPEYADASSIVPGAILDSIAQLPQRL